MSTVSKGNYYYDKTKKLLIQDGFTVEKLEKMVSYFNVKTGMRGWNKSDLMSSDCLAYNEEEFILIQNKGGAGDLKIPKAIENYEKLKVPSFIKKKIFIWRPRVKVPEVIEVE